MPDKLFWPALSALLFRPMKPELLHPAIVHLPLGIAMILPVLCLLAIWLHYGRKEESAVFARFWVAVVVCLLAASAGAVLAHETGEAGEHALKKFIEKAAIERHEFFSKIFAGLLYAASAVGVLVFFLRGRLKGFSILLVSALCVAALAAGLLTGNEGGKLVYEHKAANWLVPEKAAANNKIQPAE